MNKFDPVNLRPSNVFTKIPEQSSKCHNVKDLVELLERNRLFNGVHAKCLTVINDKNLLKSQTQRLLDLFQAPHAISLMNGNVIEEKLTIFLKLIFQRLGLLGCKIQIVGSYVRKILGKEHLIQIFEAHHISIQKAFSEAFIEEVVEAYIGNPNDLDLRVILPFERSSSFERLHILETIEQCFIEVYGAKPQFLPVANIDEPGYNDHYLITGFGVPGKFVVEVNLVATKYNKPQLGRPCLFESEAGFIELHDFFNLQTRSFTWSYGSSEPLKTILDVLTDVKTVVDATHVNRFGFPRYIKQRCIKPQTSIDSHTEEILLKTVMDFLADKNAKITHFAKLLESQNKTKNIVIISSLIVFSFEAIEKYKFTSCFSKEDFSALIDFLVPDPFYNSALKYKIFRCLHARMKMGLSLFQSFTDSQDKVKWLEFMKSHFPKLSTHFSINLSLQDCFEAFFQSLKWMDVVWSLNLQNSGSFDTFIRRSLTLSIPATIKQFTQRKKELTEEERQIALCEIGKILPSAKIEELLSLKLGFILEYLPYLNLNKWPQDKLIIFLKSLKGCLEFFIIAEEIGHLSCLSQLIFEEACLQLPHLKDNNLIKVKELLRAQITHLSSEILETFLSVKIGLKEKVNFLLDHHQKLCSSPRACRSVQNLMQNYNDYSFIDLMDVFKLALLYPHQPSGFQSFESAFKFYIKFSLPHCTDGLRQHFKSYIEISLSFSIVYLSQLLEVTDLLSEPELSYARDEMANFIPNLNEEDFLNFKPSLLENLSAFNFKILTHDQKMLLLTSERGKLKFFQLALAYGNSNEFNEFVFLESLEHSEFLSTKPQFYPLLKTYIEQCLPDLTVETLEKTLESKILLKAKIDILAHQRKRLSESVKTLNFVEELLKKIVPEKYVASSHLHLWTIFVAFPPRESSLWENMFSILQSAPLVLKKEAVELYLLHHSRLDRKSSKLLKFYLEFCEISQLSPFRLVTIPLDWLNLFPAEEGKNKNAFVNLFLRVALPFIQRGLEDLSLRDSYITLIKLLISLGNKNYETKLASLIFEHETDHYFLRNIDKAITFNLPGLTERLLRIYRQNESSLREKAIEAISDVITSKYESKEFKDIVLLLKDEIIFFDNLLLKGYLDQYLHDKDLQTDFMKAFFRWPIEMSLRDELRPFFETKAAADGVRKITPKLEAALKLKETKCICSLENVDPYSRKYLMKIRHQEVVKFATELLNFYIIHLSRIEKVMVKMASLICNYSHDFEEIKMSKFDLFLKELPSHLFCDFYDAILDLSFKRGNEFLAPYLLKLGHIQSIFSKKDLFKDSRLDKTYNLFLKLMREVDANPLYSKRLTAIFFRAFHEKTDLEPLPKLSYFNPAPPDCPGSYRIEALDLNYIPVDPDVPLESFIEKVEENYYYLSHPPLKSKLMPNYLAHLFFLLNKMIDQLEEVWSTKYDHSTMDFIAYHLVYAADIILPFKSFSASQAAAAGEYIKKSKKHISFNSEKKAFFHVCHRFFKIQLPSIKLCTLHFDFSRILFSYIERLGIFKENLEYPKMLREQVVSMGFLADTLIQSNCSSNMSVSSLQQHFTNSSKQEFLQVISNKIVDLTVRLVDTRKALYAPATFQQACIVLSHYGHKPELFYSPEEINIRATLINQILVPKLAEMIDLIIAQPFNLNYLFNAIMPVNLSLTSSYFKGVNKMQSYRVYQNGIFPYQEEAFKLIPLIFKNARKKIVSISERQKLHETAIKLKIFLHELCAEIYTSISEHAEYYAQKISDLGNLVIELINTPEAYIQVNFEEIICLYAQCLTLECLNIRKLTPVEVVVLKGNEVFARSLELVENPIFAFKKPILINELISLIIVKILDSNVLDPSKKIPLIKCLCIYGKNSHPEFQETLDYRLKDIIIAGLSHSDIIDIDLEFLYPHYKNRESDLALYQSHYG